VLADLLQFAASAAVIVAAGVGLARFVDRLSDLTGLGRLLAGTVLAAAATSLPELSVDLSAVRQGDPDLAVGDLMGSSLFNLLVLAALDLSYYSRGRMLSRAAAAHALSGTMTIAITGVAAAALLLAPRLGPPPVGEIGFGPLSILLVYALGVRLVHFDQRASAGAERPALGARGRRREVARATLGYLACAAAILLAGPRLAASASDLAAATGLGSTFFGTVFVALCTSLPELVVSLEALRARAFDLAVGNLFGSNAFNMVLLAPLDLVHPGPLLAAVSPSHALTAVATMVVTAVAVLGQLYSVERRRPFLEPDALLVAALVVATLLGLYLLR
jgi:cation:H+ antiporter